MRKHPIVALVYDFDGTLSPGNMQEFGFIQAIGKKPQEVWHKATQGGFQQIRRISGALQRSQGMVRSDQ